MMKVSDSMDDELCDLIEMMRQSPDELAEPVRGLSEADLTTPYLVNEWTVAQNVHHLADSHEAAHFRFKLILTWDRPTVPGYVVVDFARTPEAGVADIADSLATLRGINRRWARLAESLTDEQWERVGVRSDGTESDLRRTFAIYANHVHAHIDQISRTLAARGS
jgi:hypothetical protein